MGSGGKDGSGGGGRGSGQGGAGDGKSADGAPDYAKYPECGYASHPVNVVTGRAFTHPIIGSFAARSAAASVFARMYSSKMADRYAGLGYGWAHTFGWHIELSRRAGRRVERAGRRDPTSLHRGRRGARRTVGLAPPASSTGLLRSTRTTASCAVSRPRTSAASATGSAAVEDLEQNRIALIMRTGRLVEIVDSAGRIIRCISTREGRIASLEVKNAVAQGRWVAFANYAYNDAGTWCPPRTRTGSLQRYAYDEEHRLTADTDRTGLTFHFVYDRKGRCIESWGDYPGKRDPSLADDLPKVLGDHVTRAKGIHHCRFDYMPGGYSEVADSTQVRQFFGNRARDARQEGRGRRHHGGDVPRRRAHLSASTRWAATHDVRARRAGARCSRSSDPLGRVTSDRARCQRAARRHRGCCRRHDADRAGPAWQRARWSPILSAR